MSPASKLKRPRGKLLQEDGDQDTGRTNFQRSKLGYDEGRVGPQRETSNPLNQEIEQGSHPVRPQDTRTGWVGKDNETEKDLAGSQFPSRREIAPMSEMEIQSAVHKMVWDGIEYVDQELSPARALAAEYYKGEPFGNEEVGRSQVVDTVLRDTVLQMMPSFMRIFWGADRALEYAPQRKDQTDYCDQVTDYVWDVVLSQDNDGYLATYEWLKDALVKKLGILKVWYDESSETRPYEADFLSPEAMAKLHTDPEIEIESVELSAAAQAGVPLYRVEYTQTKKDGGIRIMALPPEEYIFTRGARTNTSSHWRPGVALFDGHRTELTRSQLMEIWIDEDTIEHWAFKDSTLDHNVEEIARQNIVKPDTSAIGPIATQKALYIEGYPYLDMDGDGIAELCKVVMLGPSYHVVSAEPVSHRPFVLICPDPEPHTIIGQGVSDWTMDLQRIQSSVLRAVLDSLALSINPRIAYIEGMASLEDILNTELAAPIRTNGPNAVTPLVHDFVGREGLQVRETLNEVRENRTGVTRASAGLDADALQSTTKAAAAAMVTAAQAHIEMIARTFAETGFKRLFRLVLELLVSHPPAARLVKMRGKYVEMDPSQWDAGLDVKVKVAIGAGLDEDKFEALQDLRNEMKEMFQMWGPSNPIVTPRQYRDLNVKMMKMRGQMDAENFLQEVDPNWQPPAPPQQDPNMVIAQAEQMRAQTAQQAAQAKAQLEQQKHQLAMEAKMHELELKISQQQVDKQLEEQKIRMQAEMQIAVAEIQSKTAANQQQVDAAIQSVKAFLDHAADIHKNETQADTQKAIASSQSQDDTGE